MQVYASLTQGELQNLLISGGAVEPPTTDAAIAAWTAASGALQAMTGSAGQPAAQTEDVAVRACRYGACKPACGKLPDCMNLSAVFS